MVTIIGNLIDNSFDATLSKVNKEAQAIMVSVTDFGKEVIIEVEDQGCGLPEAFSFKQLTKRGISTKSEQGRGVGLYLIQQLVDQYRGEFTVRSEQGEGTLMTIYLPKKWH